MLKASTNQSILKRITLKRDIITIYSLQSYIKAAISDIFAVFKKQLGSLTSIAIYYISIKSKNVYCESTFQNRFTTQDFQVSNLNILQRYYQSKFQQFDYISLSKRYVLQNSGYGEDNLVARSLLIKKATLKYGRNISCWHFILKYQLRHQVGTSNCP